MPDRTIEQNGAMPVPVATKTGERLEGLNVKYPSGSDISNRVPISAELKTGEKSPVSTFRMHIVISGSEGAETGV